MRRKAARRGVARSKEVPGRDDRNELLGGLIRMHILHHAAEQPIYGLWIIEELRHHGYRLSPGTAYPILHGMERRGYLRSRTQRDGRRVRRFYRATAQGRALLRQAKARLRELFGELFANE